MKIFKTVESFREWRKSQTGTIGLSPTMGTLHDGHFSLIDQSQKNCELTVISIFVNPLQFNNFDDFQNYPNTFEQDLKLLQTKNVDAVFLPNLESMYSKNSSSVVEETSLSKNLEGDSRPGHFKGVTTIVTKLFNIVQPTHAFFGEKDAQQLRIIQQMIIDLNFDIQIISVETVREKSGLAMSSRNKNLSTEDRQNASIIKSGLDLAKISLINGEKSAENLKIYIRAKINSAPNAEVLYVSVANSDTLKEIEDMKNKVILVSVAVQFGAVRLIDNFTYPSS